MSTPPKPDTLEMPKFEGAMAKVVNDPAVLKWLTKLQVWCREAILQQERQDRTIDDHQDAISDLERAAQEQRDLEDAIDRIRERMDDTVRGIYTLDETADWLRRGYF